MRFWKRAAPASSPLRTDELSTEPARPHPAAATSAAIPSPASITLATPERTDSSSSTSITMPVQPADAVPRLLAPVTVQPAACSRSAQARPIPAEAPVTSTDLPVSLLPVSLMPGMVRPALCCPSALAARPCLHRRRAGRRGREEWAHGTARAVAMSLDVVVRGITIPAEELTWRFSRSPGPGGQSVNTADTRAELSFDLAGSVALPAALKERALAALGDRLTGGVITVAASEYRSQLRNREAAVGGCSELLTEATAPPAPPRRPTKPTRAARERRLAEKQRRSQTKRLRRPTEDD